MFQMETISAKMLDYYVQRPDAYLIDLRDPKEFSKGHIKGAVNLPYDDFRLPSGINKDKILVLYCERGSSSLLIAKKLTQMGYRTRSVIGGISSYRGRNLVISG